MGFALIGQVIFPESEVAGIAEQDADDIEDRADDACRPLPVAGEKVHQRQDKQYPRE